MNIQKIDNFLNTYGHTVTSLGLLDGKMGQCLCLFVGGRMSNDQCQSDHAEKLLAEVLLDMESETATSIASGIMGIALGLTFLTQQKYIDGDINEILEDIDRYMYKSTSKFIQKEMPIEEDTPILDALLYMLVRRYSTNNMQYRRLYDMIIIQLFNYIYIHVPFDFWDEPLPFNIKYNCCVFLMELMAIYRLGIENERILHMLDELKCTIFSRMPLLHPNRLVLMATATFVGATTEKEEWSDFAKRIRAEIDVDNLLTKDIHDKSVFPTNGIMGVWIVCEIYNRYFADDKLEIDICELRERVLESSLWDRLDGDGDFIKRNLSMDGLYGIRLLVQYLDKKQ